MPRNKPTPIQESQESKPTELSPGEILTAEFEYIATSASQANEDRSKAASFFLVAVGSLVAAIFGTQQITDGAEIPTWVFQVLGLLFIILTIFGFLTIAQLARLRLAWRDSALAMNQIKQYYIDHIPGLETAFLWKAKTLPDKLKIASISFYTVLEVALLSGLTGAASAYCFTSSAKWGNNITLLTTIVGFLILALGPLFYKILLDEPWKKKDTESSK